MTTKDGLPRPIVPDWQPPTDTPQKACEPCGKPVDRWMSPTEEAPTYRPFNTCKACLAEQADRVYWDNHNT